MVPVTRSWLDLSRKVKYALGTALALDTASIVGLLSGTLGWREFALAIVTADSPVLVAYLTRDDA